MRSKGSADGARHELPGCIKVAFFAFETVEN